MARRRCLHFVPGGNEKMIAKALTLPADGLILDLEDAVPPDRKAATRPIVREWLQKLDFGGRERWVRMNPIFTDLAVADLEETIAGRPEGYIVPKARRASDVHAIVNHLERLAMALPRVRDARGQYLDIPRYARVMCAVAASAAGIEAMDTVFTDIADLDGLRRECEEAVAMGFTGKISIHPSQIEVINEAFTPSPDEVTEARELVAQFDEHAARGVFAFRFKGQMVDAPHLTRARKVIARAGG
jgi:citrate lyase subunit beta / citryl-CoA lyase